jgi:hypothetical protein
MQEINWREETLWYGGKKRYGVLKRYSIATNIEQNLHLPFWKILLHNALRIKLVEIQQLATEQNTEA